MCNSCFPLRKGEMHLKQGNVVFYNSYVIGKARTYRYDQRVDYFCLRIKYEELWPLRPSSSGKGVR